MNFYTAFIESGLTSSTTVWSAAATAGDKTKLQRSTEKVTGLPSLRRAVRIAMNFSHPSHFFRPSPLVNDLISKILEAESLIFVTEEASAYPGDKTMHEGECLNF